MAVDAVTLEAPPLAEGWPWPDAARDECGGVAWVAPQGPVEEMLASAWADVLGEPRVGRFDDFRAADGFSLLVVQVAARLNPHFASESLARELHASRAIWHLARRLEPTHVPRQAREPRPQPQRAAHARGAEPFALTPYQDALWQAQRIAAGTGLYNIALAWSLRGAVDVPALAAALRTLVQRHAALRCVFDADTGAQHVRQAPAFELDVADVADTDDAVAEAVRAEAVAPFDLAAGAFRARLLRRAPGRHVLLMTVHHLVADGWSVGLLTRQLGIEYAARLAGTATDALVPPAREYADFAHDVASRPSVDAAVQHWRAALAGPLPALELPFDRPRAAAGAARSDVVDFQWTSALEDGLRNAAQTLDCTLFELLAAAMQVWIARSTGTRDVRLAYPVANRAQPEFHGVVGCFVNTLVLCTHVDAAAPARALVADVQRALRAADHHQHLPLERLVEIAAERSESGAALWPVALNFNLADRPALELARLEVDALPRVSAGSPFALSWIVSRAQGRLGGRLEFDAARFDRATVAAMPRQLGALLQSIADGVDTPVGRLSMLDEDDRLALLRLAGDPAPPGAGPFVPVQAAFEARCRATPSAPALRVDGQTIAYARLNERANRLAHLLRAHGAAAESVVAVCLPRGADMIVALLAILKAGAAWLPLDKDQPPRRLALMRAEAGARLAVTVESLRPLLRAHPRDHVLCLDTAHASLAAQPAADLALAVHPEQLAYCLFTSGSTGTPKGVMISARALAGHVEASIARYGVHAQDRLLQFAAVTFDTSIEQMLVPLCAGACMVVRGETPWSPDELAQLLRDEAVTVADIPTAYWSQYAQADVDPLADSALRLLLIGGEGALASAAGAHRRRFPTFNAYGPTEATVTACVAEVGAGDAGIGPYVPIGRPAAGTRVHVLDDALQPVPRGVAGDIHIAGERLARGYLLRPAMTAERFVPDPFGAPGARLYRTGDRGRVMADGRLEFLGRADDQVKIRGIRIELGEVENTLRAHPAVREVAVVVGGDTADDVFLSAHVVLDAADAADAVRLHARTALPAAMVPSQWHFPHALPLTPHGKVDRKRLARMQPSRAQAVPTA
ncbi:MAG TPA: amino acid adenylation domain-containing protein, partial [Burkholderiaceae bacterium]